jgi:hypothetical protein
MLTMTKERQNNGRSCDSAVLVQTNMLGCEDAARRNCSKLRDLSGLVFRLVFSWIAKIASDRSRACKSEFGRSARIAYDAIRPSSGVLFVLRI